MAPALIPSSVVASRLVPLPSSVAVPSRGLAINIYHRFCQLASLGLSYPVFLGLCAYLHILLRWHYQIPVEQFDNFVRAYQVYKDRPSYRRISYHAWFQANPCNSYHPPILDMATLNAIADENPYTFGVVSQGLYSIAQHRGLVLTSPQPSHPTTPAKPRPDLHSAPPADIETQPRTTPPDAATSLPRLIQNVQFRPLDLDPFHAWHDEKALRKELDVQNRDELWRWIQQDWVFKIYEEYCIAVLDSWRDRRCHEFGPLSIRGSSARFIINNSIRALQLQDTHHLQDRDRTHWTQDEHDVRFITLLVSEGKQEGRWWEQQRQPGDTPTLCVKGYRLLCWLRHIHRLITTKGTGSQLQRAVDCQWYTRLQGERVRRGTRR